MNITVTHQAPMSFIAKAERGAELRLDGSADLGGDPAYFRPMEGVLASLASCSGVDIALILKKQKEPLEGFEINVAATRANAIPAVFETIHLTFRLLGPLAENKANRAVALAVDKYCSVASMLSPKVKITYTVELPQGKPLAAPASE
jgi:putative redox protein